MSTPEVMKGVQGVSGEVEDVETAARRIAPQPVKEDSSGEGASSSVGDPSPPAGPIFELNSATAAVKELQQ